MNRRCARSIVVGLVATLTASSCSIGGSGDTYKLTAEFAATVGLYPSGDVLVMGIRVGRVDDVVIDGTTVRVEMTIDADVPLPDDVGATIGQTQLIGERNVMLFPPWNQQMADGDQARAGDGDVIPLARTVVPVEPDEGLQAFNELAKSLEADTVGGLITDSATVLRGRGEQFGTAIDQAAALGTTLSEIDDQLVAGADALHRLAGSLASREDQLAQVVEHFTDATAILAAERDGISDLLKSLVALTDEGTALLDRYGGQLPADVATAAALASIMDRNGDSIDQLLSSFPELAIGLANAYQPEIDGFFLRAQLTPTLVSLLDVFAGLGVLPPGVIP